MSLQLEFKTAVHNNELSTVINLLKNKDLILEDCLGFTIRHISENGQTKILKLLLKDKRFDPCMNKNMAMDLALQLEQYKFIEILLNDPRIDPAIDNNFLIRRLANDNNIKLIKRILKNSMVDPSIGDNYCIRIAFSNGNKKLVDFLWCEQQVKLTLKNDDLEIYNELIQEDIKRKLNKF